MKQMYVTNTLYTIIFNVPIEYFSVLYNNYNFQWVKDDIPVINCLRNNGNY